MLLLTRLLQLLRFVPAYWSDFGTFVPSHSHYLLPKQVCPKTSVNQSQASNRTALHVKTKTAHTLDLIIRTINIPVKNGNKIRGGHNECFCQQSSEEAGDLHKRVP